MPGSGVPQLKQRVAELEAELAQCKEKSKTKYKVKPRLGFYRARFRRNGVS